jgi:MerR family transcriptional regulator, light-induced transcriptional regulator
MAKRPKRSTPVTHLSPRELASAVGVSESSLKRWADEGRVVVERTAGGHRRIALAEAAQFIRRSGLTPVRPEVLGLGTPDAAAADRPDAADRLYDVLLEDRAAEALGLLTSLYLNGASLGWICDEVVRLALARIGELWQHDELGIVVEHRAVDTCWRGLEQLRTLLPTPRQAPVAVGGAVSGDVYRLPTAMAALVLAEAGYTALDLGADVPAAALAAAARLHEPELVWLSASVAPVDPREVARGLAEVVDLLGAGALVAGGRAVAQLPLPPVATAQKLGSLSELAAFARGRCSAGRAGPHS